VNDEPAHRRLNREGNVMENNASNPTPDGLTAKTTTGIRIAAAALLIALGVGLFGIAGTGAVAADQPAPAVQFGARPMQFR
jgi:hypothetical protein